MDSPLQPYILEWTDALSVGIPEIDDEHRSFINAINNLNRVLVARPTREELDDIMQHMIEDAERHFNHEHHLFALHNYPDSEEHDKRHSEIKEQLADIVGKFNRSNLDRESISLGLEVKQLLVTHLLDEDMKYRDFFRDNMRP